MYPDSTLQICDYQRIEKNLFEQCFVVFVNKFLNLFHQMALYRDGIAGIQVTESSFDFDAAHGVGQIVKKDNGNRSLAKIITINSETGITSLSGLPLQVSMKL